MNNFRDLDSIYNKKAKLYKNIKIEKKVEICDLTLEADGEEMAGLKFKESERLEIAKLLDEVGAHRIAIIGNSPKKVFTKDPSKLTLIDPGDEVEFFEISKKEYSKFNEQK